VFLAYSSTLASLSLKATMQPQELSMQVDLCELLYKMKLREPAGKYRLGRKFASGSEPKRLKYARGTHLPSRRRSSLSPLNKCARTLVSRMRLSTSYTVPTRDLSHHRRRIHRVYLHPSPNLLRVSRRPPVLCTSVQ